MKERPIIFSAPMVRAILDGRKTQTRRIIKPQMPAHCSPPSPWLDDWSIAGHDYRCPYGKPGDRLWVRETFANIGEPPGNLHYRASASAGDLEWLKSAWRPSIHMPRWASRITLEVTDVRVQRLQEINEEDARAEGCTASGFVPTYNDPDNDACAPEYEPASTAFLRLWESIHGPGSWGANPWVWVISFRRLDA